MEDVNEKTTRDQVMKFIALCSSPRQNQIIDFCDWLNKEGWYRAPASTSYHGNFEGGLIRHSIGVTETLLRIKRMLLPVPPIPYCEVSDESCVIVGLFHDVHKLTDGFGRQNYVQKVLKSGKVSDSKPYEVNKEIMGMCGGYKSALVVSNFIRLYEHELQAIACHDGQYVPENRGIACKEHPLTLMLHFADMWNAILVEDQESWLYRKVSDKKLGE